MYYTTLPLDALISLRIDRLRDQLAEDLYRVDPQQIASKIIDLEIAIGTAFRAANRPLLDC